MKSIRLLLLSSFLIFMVMGCTINTHHNEVDEPDEVIEPTYHQGYVIRYPMSISLFDTVFLPPNQDDVIDISKKQTIYDLERANDLVVNRARFIFFTTV